MYLGVDIGGTDIKFGVVNAEGRIVARAAVPTPKTSAEAVADAVAAGAAPSGRRSRRCSAA